MKDKNKEEDLKFLFAIALRDSIHNLDLNIPDNKKIFSDHVKSFIRLHEEVRFETYDDKTGKPISKIVASDEEVIGNVTIGIGFNMDSGGKKGGRTAWDAAFEGMTDKEKPDFDEVYEGKLKLTPEQVDQLLDYSIKIRVQEIEKIYEESWSKLRANEKITIISAYFNSRKLVNKKTKFHAYITEYATTSDKECLLNAVTEIKENSNKDKLKGIQKRRNCEAAMLDSTKAPFYSLPNSALMPGNLKIIAGKTIVPTDIGRYSPKKTNSNYFIWRTKLDEKVRPAHLKNEGKVFLKKDYNNGKLADIYYNCRCFAEEVTQNLHIIKADLKKPGPKKDTKFINRFIRFGGGGSITLY